MMLLVLQKHHGGRRGHSKVDEGNMYSHGSELVVMNWRWKLQGGQVMHEHR